MLSPLSPRGERLLDRHTDWFLGRVGDALADPLREVDPDVVRAALRSVARTPGASLSDREWRHVVDAAVGPGLYSTHPGPFRRLALRALAGPGDSSGDGDGDGPLDTRQERLLVRKVLQAHPWDDVADELGFVSTSQCMTALGDAYRPLVDACGGEAAAAQRRRYE
jgi:tRNA(Met) cytidine acetyltransferase